MTKLVWDNPGEKTYQTGVDRGVLYIKDRPPVVWNGLVSVKETPSQADATFYYLDGQRYLVAIGESDYQGTLEAFTYPDEFAVCEGTQAIRTGFFANDQPRSSFGLSYRTLVGDDIAGIDRGYKIHLIYNAMVVPAEKGFGTVSNVTTPTNFSWTIHAVPEEFAGFRPTAHYMIDSTKVDPFLVEQLEDILYGDDTTPPRLPTPTELDTLFETFQVLTITDNGDGTWIADGPDAWIDVVGDQFEITADSAVYISADKYNISTM